jgi:hypothetical protein
MLSSSRVSLRERIHHLLAGDGVRGVSDVGQHGGRQQRFATEPIENTLHAECQNKSKIQLERMPLNLGSLQDEVAEVLPELRVLVVHDDNVRRHLKAMHMRFTETIPRWLSRRRQQH